MFPHQWLAVSEELRELAEAMLGEMIRVPFPHHDRTEFDPYSNKHKSVLSGPVRKMARKNKAAEIRRVRRMLQKDPEGQKGRAYMHALLKKSGGKASRYAGNFPNWAEVPD